jgi:O-antigen ligase
LKKIPAILKKFLPFGILAMLVISPTQFAVEVTDKVYLSVVDPIVWGLFLLLAICVVTGHIRLRCPSIFGLLLTVMVGVSALRASSRMSTMKELFQMVEYFVIAYMLLSFLISDAKRRAVAVYLFAGVGTLIVIISLVQYMRPSLPPLDIAGTFGNRNVLAGYLAILLPLTTGLMLYEKNRFRLAWYALTVIAGSVVLLSGGALMGIILGLAIVAMLRGRIAFAGLAAILLLAIFLIAPHLPRDNATLLRESVQLFDDDGNVTRRYTEWQAAATMTQDNPLLGVGAGNYQDNVGMYYGVLPDPVGPTEPDTQNLYIVTASSIGLFGLAALIGLLCHSVASAIRNYASARSGFERGLQAGLIGSILAFAIAAIWSPLLVRGISIPLAFILVLAAQGPDQSDSERT